MMVYCRPSFSPPKYRVRYQTGPRYKRIEKERVFLTYADADGFARKLAGRGVFVYPLEKIIAKYRFNIRKQYWEFFDHLFTEEWIKSDELKDMSWDYGQRYIKQFPTIIIEDYRE